MNNQFSRSELLLGKENIEKLQTFKVAVFGLGGVGGNCVETLARSGITHFVLVDNDEITLTNLNRQLLATHSTIGRKKVNVCKQRILDINPNAQVEIYDCFYLPDNNIFDFSEFDYVIDCIDTVSAKIDLIVKCQEINTPIISCMGTGNKLDPTKLEISDIYKTSVCPLAKVMRHELKKCNVKKCKVLYSKEEPLKPAVSSEETNKKSIPGSVSFVPPVAGIIIAGEVIKDLINNKG